MLIAMWFVFFFPLFAFSVNILALVVRRSRKRISHDLHEMINCTRHGTIFIALVSFTWHHHHHYHHQFEWHANNEMELNRTHLMTNRRARPHLSSAPPPHLSHSESEIFVKFLNSSKGKVFVFQVRDCTDCTTQTHMHSSPFDIRMSACRLRCRNVHAWAEQNFVCTTLFTQFDYL